MRHRASKGGYPYESAGQWYLRLSGTVETVGPDGTVVKKRRQWSDGPYPTREATLRARQLRDPHVSVEMESITWHDWIDTWFALEDARLRLQGQDSYADLLDRYFRLHLRPNLTGRVAATTSGDLTHLWKHLVDQGLKPGYVRRIRSALGKCFIAAQAQGLSRPNPVKASIPPKQDWRTEINGKTQTVTPIGLGDALTAAEYRVARSALEAVLATFYWATAAITAGETGLRRGETLGLQWIDLNVADRTLRIERQVIKPKKGPLKLGPLKTQHSYRTITVGDYLLDLLLAHREVTGGADEDQMFPGEDGGLAHPNTFTKAFSAFATKTGIRKHFTLHNLRHTHLTLLLRARTSDIDVSRRAGHHSSNYTRQKYVRFLSDPNDGVGDRWDQITSEDFKL